MQFEDCHIKKRLIAEMPPIVILIVILKMCVYLFDCGKVEAI